VGRLARVGLGAGEVLNGSVNISNSDLSDFTVHLKEDLTLTSLLREGTDSKQLKDKDLSLLNLDTKLLTNLRTGQEVLSRENRKVSVLGAEVFVVLEDLGVHDVSGDVALGGKSVLLLEFGLDLSKVKRRK
jgi:Sec7-like guanine-nucleotide exchange factor